MPPRRILSRTVKTAILVACLAGGGGGGGGASLWTPGAVAAELLSADGSWVTGTALASTRGGAGRLTVGDRTVPVDRVVALRLSTRDRARPQAGMTAATDTVERGMVLRNGDLLLGVVESLQAGEIAFLSDSFGRISPPAESVLAFSFRPYEFLDFAEASDRPPGAVLSNGDFVRGKVVFVNRETIGVDNGRRVVRVPRERTAFVKLGQGRAQRARTTSVQFVRLANGDRLSGSLRRLNADVLELETTLDTESAGVVEVPVAMVVELWSEGGPLVPVSTLEPVEVRQVPQFDESFPHQRDGGLAGGFLSVGGKRFERGLGCHSRCELEYELPGRCSSFLAEIGVDDSSGGRGNVVFRVLADGKTVFDSGPVRGGEPARTVKVALRGARRMRLIVDFGPDGSSVGDHADWGRAVLVRE